MIVDSVAPGGFGFASASTSMRKPERVRPEDELVAAALRHPARLDQHVKGGHPLLLGQPDLAGEVVQVPHERLHELAEPPVVARVEAGMRRSGDVLWAGADVALRHAGILRPDCCRLALFAGVLAAREGALVLVLDSGHVGLRDDVAELAHGLVPTVEQGLAPP